MPSFNRLIALAEIRGLVNDTIRRSPRRLVSERLSEAARWLHLPESRVRDWHYGEVRSVEAWEADQIRHYAGLARGSELRRLEREIDRLRTEIAQLDPLDGVRPAVAPRLSRRARGRRGGHAPA